MVRTGEVSRKLQARSIALGIRSVDEYRVGRAWSGRQPYRRPNDQHAKAYTRGSLSQVGSCRLRLNRSRETLRVNNDRASREASSRPHVGRLFVAGLDNQPSTDARANGSRWEVSRKP